MLIVMIFEKSPLSTTVKPADLSHTKKSQKVANNSDEVSPFLSSFLVLKADLISKVQKESWREIVDYEPATLVSAIGGLDVVFTADVETKFGRFCVTDALLLTVFFFNLLTDGFIVFG